MCFCPIHPPTHRLVDKCLTQGHVLECTVHKTNYHEPHALCVKCEAVTFSPENQERGEKGDRTDIELEQFLGDLLLLLLVMGIMVLLGRSVANWIHQFQRRGEPPETCGF